jgi:hypothetical protein
MVLLRLASHSDISGSISRVSVRLLSSNMAGVLCSVVSTVAIFDRQS